jgi:diguanylate cyclase (GGDEF)-like protein
VADAPSYKNRSIDNMYSIRTKITIMTVCAIIITMVFSAVFGVIAIRKIGNDNSNQILLLLCESGEKNLDSYFDSVEQSVEMVAAYVESDLDGLSDKELQDHMDRVSDIFKKMTYDTNGILTYYYRIDPSISTKTKGFWYVNQDGKGFKEHKVTDITQYDTNDTSKLVWFTVPKATKEPVWLPPYITDNLGARVISYNTPVYLDGRFVGVIGIEIDYKTMAEQVDSITLYENGYAFLNDEEGNIIYHPKMDVTSMEYQPKVPKGLLSKEKFIRYSFDGVEKQAVWLPLHNGMHLNVTVPVSEINASWTKWGEQILVVFGLMLLIFIVISMWLSGRITKPLRDLAYSDALTSLHNKGAFDIQMNRIQSKIDEKDQVDPFAVCIFDCNNLKKVNDEFGHDKGDLFLKDTADVICQVFDHSPVYRIGGDEFAAILQNRDFQKREQLLNLFDERCMESRLRKESFWEQIDVARGMAVYDSTEDKNVNDVVRRADKLMYEHKWRRKHPE